MEAISRKLSHRSFAAFFFIDAKIGQGIHLQRIP